MKKLLIVGMISVSLVTSPTVSFAGPAVVLGQKFGTGPIGWMWGVFGCSGGIIFSAMAANWQQNRQLTASEAATCGILFWFNPPKRK
jgi:hypothetical protein